MSERQLTDLGLAALNIRKAIRDEGSHPGWHRRIMELHRKEWPTLWGTLDRLLELVESEPPAEAK